MIDGEIASGSWNHRVIKTTDAYGAHYNVHECFYANKGDKIPNSWTENPVSPYSDTPDGLKWVLEQMTKALTIPILYQDGYELKEIK